MHIMIDDVQYTVSIRWNWDGKIEHFVWIHDELVKLDLELQKIWDSKTSSISSLEVRKIVEQEIRKRLDDGFSDWWPRIQ